MNRKMVLFILGRILLVEGALMVPAMTVGFIHKEEAALSFIIPIAILAALGALMSFKKPKNTEIYSRDGLFIVSCAWVVMSLFGALPFYLSGCFNSYVDCFFEVVSGFTTTGSSILPDPGVLPKSILFWRSFTHWVGGMGVLVFVMAILPLSDERALHLMRAEAPGPVVGKLVPKMKDTAKILYGIYIVMTALLTVILLFCKMPLFDALCNAFGTAGTGGFSTSAAGIGGYNSPFIEMVIAVFMILFGINFNLYYLISIKRLKTALKSTELWIYIAIIAVSTVLITVNIYPLFSTLEESVRASFFQVSSIMTTTGYSTADFNLWPSFSKGILFILMFIGGCAGSTAGGLKVSRAILLFKMIFKEIRHMIHPRSVAAVKFEGKDVDDHTQRSVASYFAVYMIFIAITFFIISLEPFDFETIITATVACFNNVGPGFSLVGPMGSYAEFSDLSKLVLSFAMLLGRLEIFPLIIAFIPSTWTRKK